MSNIQVHVVLEIIDLGDHIVSIHFSEHEANLTAQRLNDEWVKKYPNNRATNYHVEEHTIQP